MQCSSVTSLDNNWKLETTKVERTDVIYESLPTWKKQHFVLISEGSKVLTVKILKILTNEESSLRIIAWDFVAIELLSLRRRKSLMFKN